MPYGSVSDDTKFKKVLGFTEIEAVKAWPAFHDIVEKELSAARLPAQQAATMDTVRTTMDHWRGRQCHD